MMGSACDTYGKRRGACSVLVVKPERRKPLGRQQCRWKENIKMGFLEIGWV